MRVNEWSYGAKCKDVETLTVAAASIGLASAAGLALATNGKGNAYVEVYVTAAALTYWEDGTAPTAGVGVPIPAGGSFIVTSANIANLRMIRSTATSAVCYCQYKQ